MAITPGKGATLKVTISGTPTTIGQIVSITAPQISNPTVDTTDLDDTWRTFQSTILDGGELTFVINWDTADTQHAALWTKLTGGASEVWLVTYADTGATTVGFSGPITSFQPSAAVVDGIVTATLTIKVSGAITLTP